MKTDIHNHAVPEPVVQFFERESAFGLTVTGERHLSGGPEGEYELEPAFYDADAVTFDDSGAYSNVVTLAGELRPASLVVDSSSNYTFQGTGGILGAASLTKSGAGTLTMLNTNNYSGVTRVNEGVLQIGNTGAKLWSWIWRSSGLDSA